MEDIIPSIPSQGRFDEEKNPLTDREVVAENAEPTRKIDIPKGDWRLMALAGGIIGIGIAIGGYLTVKYLLFTYFPFTPQGQAGLDILLSLTSILLSFIIESLIPLIFSRSRQVESLILSWGFFFGALLVGSLFIAGT